MDGRHFNCEVVYCLIIRKLESVLIKTLYELSRDEEIDLREHNSAFGVIWLSYKFAVRTRGMNCKIPWKKIFYVVKF